MRGGEIWSRMVSAVDDIGAGGEIRTGLEADRSGELVAAAPVPTVSARIPARQRLSPATMMGAADRGRAGGPPLDNPGAVAETTSFTILTRGTDRDGGRGDRFQPVGDARARVVPPGPT